MSDQTALSVVENQFLAPVAPLQAVLMAYQAKKELIDHVLRPGVDFGPIPGSDKPALKKPGAEKLAGFFGLAPDFIDVQSVEDWDGAEHSQEPFFYYRVKCILRRGERVIASADGSCNSRETKYRYRWVNEFDIPYGTDKSQLVKRGGKISEFQFAIEKAETTGKYGKPPEYWQRFKDAIEDGNASPCKKVGKGKEYPGFEIDSTAYRLPNPDVSDQVNTILKMAQKRALVAAVLIATGASDYFTQDVDDFIDGTWHEAESATPTASTKPTAEPAPAQSAPATKQGAEPENPARRAAYIAKYDEQLATAIGLGMDEIPLDYTRLSLDNIIAAYKALKVRVEKTQLDIARMNGQTEEG